MELLTIAGGAYLASKFFGPKSGGVNVKSYQKVITEYGDKIKHEISKYNYRLPDSLVMGVLYTESAGDPNAVGDGGKSIGLFQLQRAALADAHAFNSDVTDDFEELKKPNRNIEAGVAYLHWLYSRTLNEWEAVIAYNIGLRRVVEGASEEWLERGKNYLSRVLRFQKKFVEIMRTL